MGKRPNEPVVQGVDGRDENSLRISGRLNARFGEVEQARREVLRSAWIVLRVFEIRLLFDQARSSCASNRPSMLAGSTGVPLDSNQGIEGVDEDKTTCS
jgi:hypothetical protein